MLFMWCVLCGVWEKALNRDQKGWRGFVGTSMNYNNEENPLRRF